MLRRSVDVVSVGLVGLSLGLMTWATLTSAHWLWVLPIIAGMRWSHLVQHNLVHLPIFRSRWADDVLGWAITLVDSIPLEFYRIQHHSVHHKDPWGRTDWPSPYWYQGTQPPHKPVSKAWFVATYAVIFAMGGFMEILRRPTTRASRRFWVSTLVVVPVVATLAWLHPANFAVFFLLPWAVGWFVAPFSQWDQHAGCDLTQPHTLANNDLRWHSTELGLNIGFHTAHHDQPTLHWSDLRQHHERHFAHRTPAACYIGGIGVPEEAPAP